MSRFLNLLLMLLVLIFLSSEMETLRTKNIIFALFSPFLYFWHLIYVDNFGYIVYINEFMKTF